VTKLHVHIEQIVVEQSSHSPVSADLLAAALERALQNEFAAAPGADDRVRPRWSSRGLGAGVERAVRAVLAAPSRHR